MTQPVSPSPSLISPHNSVMHQRALALPHRLAKSFWFLSLFLSALSWMREPANAQPSNLIFSSVTTDGSNLIMSGSGGVIGVPYFVMSATNLGPVPITQWMAISTGSFAASGLFTSSIPIDITIPQNFFLLAMTPDAQAPTAPSGLTVTSIGTNQINLSWIASTDNVAVTSYLLERSQGVGSTNFSQIATPSVTNYSDTGLAAVSTYNYRVRATDASGNLSDRAT